MSPVVMPGRARPPATVCNLIRNGATDRPIEWPWISCHPPAKIPISSGGIGFSLGARAARRAQGSAESKHVSLSARTLDPADLERLRWATRHLEHPSLAARLTSVVGTPIEIAVNLLPRPVYHQVRGWADAAIYRVMDVAASSLHQGPHAQPDPRNGFYRGLAATTGAIGGFFGIYGLLVELPISTTLMLRSIAEIARTEGEDLSDADTRMACLEVFALGGHSESDDAAEAGYYGIRLALALSVTRAASHLAEHGLAGRGAPVLVEAVQAIAARFGAVVSEKVAAQLVPLVGAAGGAAINLAFMSHYQEMARGHFVVRALERRYGKDLVQAHYEAIRESAGAGRGDAGPRGAGAPA